MSEDGNIASSGSGSVPLPAQTDWCAKVTTIQDAQRAMAAEAVLSATEALERIRTEYQLWNELISKLATASSVKDLATVWEECGRHQLDFSRRQTELCFDHGLHALEVATGLLKGPKPDRKTPA